MYGLIGCNRIIKKFFENVGKKNVKQIIYNYSMRRTSREIMYFLPPSSVDLPYRIPASRPFQRSRGCGHGVDTDDTRQQIVCSTCDKNYLHRQVRLN